MADLTIHELQNEATTPAADDYAVLDGATAGTRKITPANLATWIHNKWAAFVNALTSKTSFASGDKIPVVNGSTATAMEASKLLELTAQNALAGNVAPAFDPNRTSENPYKVGESVAYNGKTYTFKVDHYGAWSSAHANAVPASDKVDSSFLIGKRIACFGDSITYISDSNAKSYVNYIAEKTYAKVMNQGIIGSCIAGLYESSESPEDYEHAVANLSLYNIIHAWINNDWDNVDAAVLYIKTNNTYDYTSVIQRLKNTDISTIDYLTIFAGTNDFSKSVPLGEVGTTDGSTTLGALGNIIDEVLTANGSIKILVFTPTIRWFGNMSSPSVSAFSDYYVVNGHTLPEVVNLVKMECELKHIPCCDMYNDIGWNMSNFFTYFRSTDGTHPYKGLEYIADKMVAFIRNSVTSLSDKHFVDSVAKSISSLERGVGLVNSMTESASFIKIFHSADYVAKTYVDGTGVIVAHNNRAATPELTPVSPGDIVKIVPNGTAYATVYLSYYNSSKTFVSNTSNSGNVSDGAGGDFVVPSGVAFMRVTGVYASAISSADVFDKCVVLERLSMVTHYGHALHTFKGKFETKPVDITFTADFLEQGYYTTASADNTMTITGFSAHAARVRSSSPIAIHKGDCIYTADIDFIFSAFICAEGSNVVLQSISYGTSIVSQFDGVVYIHGRNTNSANIVPSDVGGKLKIERNKYEPVFISDSSYLRNGYWKSDMTIGEHTARLINCRDVICNKGDMIFVNTPSLQMNVREVALDGTILVSATGYYASIYVPPGDGAKASHYVVKNDGVKVLLQFAPLVSGNPPISPADYGDCFRIVRASALPFKAQARKWITPKASKKGRVIPCEEVMMQDGCMVGDKLWMSIDNYLGTNLVKVVNPTTGAIERTISHDFGHNGISDYWAGNDTGLVANGLDIYLIPNLSEVTTTMAKADAIKLTLSDGHTGSGPVCFGEDMQTMYIAVTYNLADGIDHNKVYKYRLGMADGEYDGTATLLKTYDIVYHDDEDVDFGPQNTKYAQSVKYDGYLYFAIGTSGHNFLVLDVNDETLEAVAVGRYEYFVHDTNGDQVWLEPELLALNGSDIICGSRSTASSVVSLVELTR